MDEHNTFNKFRDSHRYFNVEKSIHHLQARSKSSYKGGAMGDQTDSPYRDPQKKIKNYRNYEKIL